MLNFVQNKHNAVVDFVIVFHERVLQQTQSCNKGIVALTTVEQRWLSQKHQPHDLITTNEQHHDGVRYCNR